MIDGITTQIHPEVQIAFSTALDGSMSAGGGAESSAEHQRNVNRFLQSNRLGEQRIRLFVAYGDNRTYTECHRVDKSNLGEDFIGDALYTTDEDCLITLPVADCVATVVYDPAVKMLGVLHLGRHSSVMGLIEAFIIEVADTLGSDPRQWHIWMSPSIRKNNDKLDYFDPPMADNWQKFTEHRNGKVYIDTVGHNTSRFLRAGVPEDQISISPICTYEDKRFFSHRAYCEVGDSKRLGRMMVAARIIPRSDTI